MKRKLLAILISASIIFSAFTSMMAFTVSAADAEENLLINGGFETGDITGWNSVSEYGDATIMSASDEVKRSGSYGAYSTQSSSINQTFTVSSNGIYTATAYVRGGNASGTGYMEICKGAGTDGEVVSSGSVTFDGWTWCEITFDFEAVSGEEYTLYVYRSYPNQWMTLNVDDASVVLKEKKY